MNAVSILKDALFVGAKEFRAQLPAILRHPRRSYRVLLQNRPAVAVLPDDQFVRILELLQELDAMGLLQRAAGRLRAAGRGESAWFRSEAWQRGHRASRADIRSGRVKRFGSMAELLSDLGK